MGLILDEDVDFERYVNAASFSFLLSTPHLGPRCENMIFM